MKPPSKISPNRDAYGRWLGGQCGNPLGYGPGGYVARQGRALELCIDRHIGEGGEEVVAVLAQIALAREVPMLAPDGEPIVDQGGAQVTLRPSLALTAAVGQWLIERRYGKAAQSVDIVDRRGDAPDLSRLSDAQLVELSKILADASPGALPAPIGPPIELPASLRMPHPVDTVQPLVEPKK